MAANKQPKKKTGQAKQSAIDAADKRYSLAPLLEDDESFAQETNILNLEGFLFDLRRRHGSNTTAGEYEETYTDPEGRQLRIMWHPKYGRPTTVAYNVLQALFKKSTSEKYPFEKCVAFHENDILRLCGKSNAGKDHKALYVALKQLQNTTITYEFYNKQLGKTAVADVKVLGTVVTVRDDSDKTKIEQALVYWDQFIVDSMNADYWAAFNWSRMEDLDAVQSILFKRLFHHFSKVAGAKINALSEDQRQRLSNVKACLNTPLQKDLLDIFNFWLGGLKLPKHKSQIVQKYGDRLNGLKKKGLIKSWKVEKRKNGDGFKLVATPGSAFSDDYLGFYHSKLQPQLKFNKAKDDEEIKDPVELLILFHEARSATGKANTESFSTKEVELAADLITRHNLTGAREFINYGLHRAREDKFKVRFLMGIMQYEDDWLGTRDQSKALEAKRIAAEKERIEEELELAYKRFCEAECDAWFSNQPTKAQQKFNDLAQRKLNPNTIPAARKTMHLIELRKIIRQLLSLPSYEEWKKHRA